MREKKKKKIFVIKEKKISYGSGDSWRGRNFCFGFLEKGGKNTVFVCNLGVGERERLRV